MVSGNVITVVIAAAYLVLVLGIGEYARRSTRLDREDFFMASRSFGTIVLLFTILATNMTAFVVIGGPGIAYREGIGAYGYVNGIFTLVFPVMMATVGYRLWLVGKKFGHITPGEMFNHRYESTHLGTVVMVLMLFWTVPYIMIGAMGSGIVFETLTEGLVPYWAGALVVLLIVFTYVNAGGMRGTAWTNTFQGVVMIGFLWLFLAYLGLRLGGFVGATEATLQQAPAFATRDGSPVFGTKIWLSFAIILFLNMLMNPHIFRRMMTGLSIDTIRRMVVLYPIGTMLIWLPPVVIGFWGVGQMPGLDGVATDQILPLMVVELTGPFIGGLALAGILAAVMSSIDAQTLTVSTLVSEDAVRNYFDVDESKQVVIARSVVGILLAIVFAITLMQPGTIFEMGELAFSGYALLLFPLIVGFYWRRATKEAAYVGIIWGFVGLWGFLLGVFPESLQFGFLPIVPVLAVQIVLTLAVTLVTSPPSRERVEAYFDVFENVW